jgi:C1A family cysteine protease
MLRTLVFPFVLLASFSNFAKASDTPTYISKKYETKHSRGFIQSESSHRFLLAAPRTSFVGAKTSFPASYSLRGQAGPVENQGKCGSCWDFSLTTVLRGTWIMAGKDPGRLSFNYLLNCDNVDQGCDGGDFSAADFFVNPKGVPLYGSDGNYVGKSSACNPQPVAASTANYHMLGANGENPSFKDIAYVVGILHRPVSIDIAADDTWEGYGGGVYNRCSDEDPNDINHMVAIEGYDCGTNVDKDGNCIFDGNGNLPAGVGTWLVRNSWGTDWGDKGYITMKATDSNGARCNAVATDALYYDLSDSALGLQ